MYEGEPISFNDVKTTFVDKANFPSPKDWYQGTYDNGKELYPRRIVIIITSKIT